MITALRLNVQQFAGAVKIAEVLAEHPALSITLTFTVLAGRLVSVCEMAIGILIVKVFHRYQWLLCREQCHRLN